MHTRHLQVQISMDRFSKLDCVYSPGSPGSRYISYIWKTEHMCMFEAPNGPSISTSTAFHSVHMYPIAIARFCPDCRIWVRIDSEQNDDRTGLTGKKGATTQTSFVGVSMTCMSFEPFQPLMFQGLELASRQSPVSRPHRLCICLHVGFKIHVSSNTTLKHRVHQT
jgi:hypothetical protein